MLCPQAVGILVTYGLCFRYFPVCVIVIPAIAAYFWHPALEVNLRLSQGEVQYLGLYSASLHRCNIDASNLFLNFASDQIVPTKLRACQHDTLISVVKRPYPPPLPEQCFAQCLVIR